MRLKLLLTNVAAGLGVRALNLVGTLVIVPMCIAGLGPDDYGHLAIILSATVFFAFADLGMGLALVNHLSSAASGPDEARGAVSRTWLLLCAMGAVLCAVALATGIARAAANGFATPVFDLWTWSILIVGMGLPTGISQRILFARQQAYLAGLWSAAGRLASIAAVYAAWQLHGGPIAFAAAVLGAPVAVGWLANLWLLVVHAPDLRPRLRDVARPSLISDLRTGLAFTVLQLSNYAETGMDNLLIGLFRRPLDVTHYDLMYRLFLYVPALVSIAAFPLWPALRSALTSGDAAWARRATRIGYAVTLAATAPVALVLLLSYEPLVRLWTGTIVPPVPGLAAGLALASVLTSLALIQSLRVSAHGYTGAQAKLQLLLVPLLLVAKISALWMFDLSAFVAVLVLYYVLRTVLCERLFRKIEASPHSL